MQLYVLLVRLTEPMLVIREQNLPQSRTDHSSRSDLVGSLHLKRPHHPAEERECPHLTDSVDYSYSNPAGDLYLNQYGGACDLAGDVLDCNCHQQRQGDYRHRSRWSQRGERQGQG